MALSADIKQQIIDRHLAGESEKQIAGALGIKLIGVYGTIQGYRVKHGLEEPPAKGKGKRQQKTAKVHEESEIEIPDGYKVAAVPIISGSEAPCPLFPAIAPGRVAMIQVTRFHSRPHAGNGVLGSVPADATENDILEMWGGGWYQLQGLNASGSPIGSMHRTIKSPLRSLPAQPEELGDIGEAYPVSPTTTPVLEQVLANQQRQLEEARSVAGAQYEERMRYERQLSAERQKEQMSLWAQMQAMQQQGFQQLMQLRAPESKSGMLEKLGLELIMQRLNGGGGDGSEPKDSLAVLIEKAPELIGSVVELVRLNKEVPMLEAPQQAAAPAPAQSPPPDAQETHSAEEGDEESEGDDDYETPTIQDIGDDVIDLLMANGLTEEQAEQVAQSTAQVLISEAKRFKQQTPQPAKNGNGKAPAVHRVEPSKAPPVAAEKG